MFTNYKVPLLGLMLTILALVVALLRPAIPSKKATNQKNDLGAAAGSNNSTIVLTGSQGAEATNFSQNTIHRGNTAADFVARQLAKGKKPNRLIHEKSPYLLQHSFNPVEWYPWGQEAFEKARKEDKPIFLSIGYSTCHWCHVMAHESFDNPEIAAILNQHYVSIKVDREERPDLDRVYIKATQALTGSGGWPMSVFLTHDLKPFYAGTYFPPKPQYGLPGFPDLLEAIHQAWAKNRQKILQAANQITSYLQQRTHLETADTSLTASLLLQAYQQTALSYDKTYGGFGNAPKFPRPVTFNFLLRYYHRSGEKKALEMVRITLRKMAEGGIRDHIGGGFHRYSVDGQWRVPHFEKMLYDQAQLAISYLEVYQISKDPWYAGIARDILDYVLRDMAGPHGGFYSAEDADSPLPKDPEQQGEGAFYLFTEDEIVDMLGAEAGKIFTYYYGIKDDGNALSDPQKEFIGKNIFYIAHSVDETAHHFGKSTNAVEKMLSDTRRRLFHLRAKRPRPHLDDKVITSWNGLMISALARGYQVLTDPRYLQAAERSASFITSKLYDSKQKVLLRRYRDTAAGLEAHLDDYAFLVQGLLDLYEASLSISWLIHAINLTERQIDLFSDARAGGFYDTSGNDKTVLLRMKEDYEGAQPTGNSVAALNLLRLAQMIANEKWQQQGAKTITTFADLFNKYPTVMPQMLVALDFQLQKPKQIVIAGKPGAADTNKMLREVYNRFLPNKIILFADGGKGQKFLSKYLPFLASVSMIDGKATAYICENYTCKLPTTDVRVMVGLLEN